MNDLLTKCFEPPIYPVGLRNTLKSIILQNLNLIKNKNINIKYISNSKWILLVKVLMKAYIIRKINNFSIIIVRDNLTISIICLYLFIKIYTIN